MPVRHLVPKPRTMVPKFAVQGLGCPKTSVPAATGDKAVADVKVMSCSSIQDGSFTSHAVNSGDEKPDAKVPPLPPFE